MSDRTNLPEEIRDLIDDYCSDVIDDEQLRKLEAYLLADEHARREFVAYFHLHTELQFAVRAKQAADSVLKLIDDQPPRRALGSRVWWAAAAAAVLMVGLAWLWPKNRQAATVANGPSPPVSPSTVLDSLAMVVKLDGVRWEATDGTAPKVGDVLKPRRLRMDSGVATLAFFGGATLSLEGPADVDLIGDDRVYCRRGRLRARVSDGARSFVVLTSESAVVDRGTEFGFNVEADGRSRLMVFEGAAEAALLDHDGALRRTQLVTRSQEFALDPQAGRISATSVQPEGFIDPPNIAVPPLELDPEYPLAVLQSRPRGYWRFESESGQSVPNEVPDSSPLRMNGPVAITRDTGRNGCAVFKPGAPEQFLFADGPWELSRESGHAVEVWFLAESYRYASLVGLYPPQTFNPPDQSSRFLHAFFVEQTGRGREELHKPASIRFLHRWPLDVKVQCNLFSEGYYFPRRWHHVVAQKKGDRMEVYFDGVLDRSLRIEPDYPTLPCHLVVGRRTPDASDPKDSRAFVGRIDELALYDHTLSNAEVRRHFQLATRRNPPE
jgi:hypothetical protein